MCVLNRSLLCSDCTAKRGTVADTIEEEEEEVEKEEEEEEQEVDEGEDDEDYSVLAPTPKCHK